MSEQKIYRYIIGLALENAALQASLNASIAGNCLKCHMGPRMESCAYPEACEHPARALKGELADLVLIRARLRRCEEALRNLVEMCHPFDNPDGGYSQQWNEAIGQAQSALQEGT